MMSYRKILMRCLAASVTAGKVAMAAGPGGDLPAVRVDLVKTLETSEPKPYVGTVAADETVHLTARVSGTLWKAAFKEGSMVKEGDLLFEIEDTIYKANLEVAQSVLKQTEAELAYARKEHDRFAALYKSQATAEATYNSMLRSKQVYEAKYEEAKANLILSQNDFSYTKIYAPLAGRIGSNLHSEGNYITPATGTLATIVQLDPIKVKFSMSEADFFSRFDNYEAMKPSDLVILRANGESYQGNIKLDFVDNLVDTRTGTITVQLECTNPDMQLIPGGYVKVLLAEKFEKPQPAIAVAGIMTDGSKHYCYVVNADDVIERRDLVIGRQVQSMQIISSGLAAGERVVIGGLNKIRPGSKVNPVSLQSAEQGGK